MTNPQQRSGEKKENWENLQVEKLMFYMYVRVYMRVQALFMSVYMCVRDLCVCMVERVSVYVLRVCE